MIFNRLMRIFSQDFWVLHEDSDTGATEREAIGLNHQIQMLRLSSAHYCKELKKEGDNPEIAREIVHYFHFRKNANVEKLIRSTSGFHAVVGKFPVFDLPGKIGTKITVIDKTNKESVNAFIKTFWEIAIENNGEYIKWETFPVNDRKNENPENIQEKIITD